MSDLQRRPPGPRPRPNPGGRTYRVAMYLTAALAVTVMVRQALGLPPQWKMFQRPEVDQ